MQRSLYTQSPQKLFFSLAALAVLGCLAGMFISAALSRAAAQMGNAAWLAGVSAVLTSISVFAIPSLIFWHFSTGIKRGLHVYAPRWDTIVYTAMAVLALQPFLQFITTFTRDFLEYALSADIFGRLAEAQAAREGSIARIVGDRSWGSFPVAAFVLGIVPALCEEFFFRGTLQRLLIRLSHRKSLSVIIVSIVFTAIHLDWFNCAGIFLCSVFLGYLYIYTSNIWVPVAFHLVSNLWNIFLIYAAAHMQPEQMQEADGLIPWWSALISIVLAALLVRMVRTSYLLKRKKHLYGK